MNISKGNCLLKLLSQINKVNICKLQKVSRPKTNVMITHSIVLTKNYTMRIKLQSKISNVNQKDKAKRKQNTKENNSQRHLFDTEKMCNAVFTLTINLDKHTYIYIYTAKKLNMKRYLRNATSVFQFCKFKNNKNSIITV